MIGMGSVSVTNIKNGKDGTPGIGISNTYVQYCYGGSATDPPGEYLKDENGILLIDETGKFLTNGEWQADVPAAQPGLYLWSRTVTTFDDGNESYMYSIGREGLGILNEKKQFYLSSSLTELKDGYWSDVEPYPIPEGKYLFGRYEFIMTDGSIQYSDAYYENVLSGVINKTDNLEKSITMKIWETDIDAKISDFDSEYQIIDRITAQELNVDGIWTSITDQNTKTITKPDGTVVTTMASRVHEVEETAVRYGRLIEGSDSVLGQTSTLAEQTANQISWVVKSGTSESNFTITDRTATLTATYINTNGLITFNGLDKTTVRDRIGKSETLLSTWTNDATLATTTINGGYIRSHTIVADHLATNAIMSFGKQNQQTGQYTGGYSRDANSKFSSTGSFFDMENGNIFTPSFSIINTIPAGENLTTGGFFSGNVVAQTGNIGGWTIDGNLLYSVAKTPGSTSMMLTPTGVTSTTSIGGSTGSKTWALTIKDKFGVTADGYMYATNADISGKITSTSGSIGGINVNNIGIYTGTKQAANSTQDGFLISNTGAIYLGAYNSTRNSTAFQVNPNGYVKAYNIDALGGSVGGWTITDTMLYYNSATSSTPTRPSTTSIILSPRGNTPSPAVSVGGSGTATKNWGMTIGTGFGVTTSGELWCNQAHVTGTIFATAGKIGDCEIINGHLNVASATIDEIDGSKIIAGTISADRININNLGDLSTVLGNITSGSFGYSSSGNNNINLNTTATKTSLSYGKTSFDDYTAGFYLGTDGLSIGQGDSTYGNPFSVSSDGSLSVKGEITANVLKMYMSDSNPAESQFIKAQAVESFGASVRIGQSTTTGSYIDISYSTRSSSSGQGTLVSPGTIKIGAPDGVIVGNSSTYSGLNVYGNISIYGTNNGESNSINAGIGYIDKLYTQYIDVTSTSNNRLVIQGNSFDTRGDVEADNFYARNNYRIFYWKDSSHPNETVQCIESNTPSNFGSPKGVSGTQKTWIRFGSTSSYNCMAMPVNGSSIYFRVKSSSDSSYTWYNLKTDIIDKLGTGGGGTSYSFNSNEFTVSNNTVSLKNSYLTSSDLSGYATQTWVNNKGYLTSSSLSGYATETWVNNKGYAEKTNTSQVILAKQLKAADAIYMEKKTHSTTTSATWVSAGSTQPSGMSDAYRLYLVSSSSKRYKDHIGVVDMDYASKILDIPVVKFKYKDGYLVDDDEFYGVTVPGLYAEDVEAAIPEAVYHQDGLVENWTERTLLPLMLRVIQDQQKRIEELEKKLIQ